MYKINEVVMYRNEVCEIKEIKKNKINNKDYYVLNPLVKTNTHTVYEVPCANIANNIKNIMSKKEVEDLINEIPSIETLEFKSSMAKNRYQELLKSGNRKDLVKIIKTTYLNNEERLKNNKKIGSVDDYYFKMAEDLLYKEIAAVLGLSLEETRLYITNKIKSL